MQVNVNLPIAKYSHVVSEELDNASWNHIESRDLSVVVQGGDDGSLAMYVIHATTNLESIDIAYHVDEALRLKRQAQIIKLKQLPIYGLFKELHLALVYRMVDRQVKSGSAQTWRNPLEMSQARRIQLKFYEEADCRQVVNILEKRGLIVQLQHSTRPDTARASTGPRCPDTARSGVRPLTAQTTSSYFPQSSQQSGSAGNRLQGLGAGSLLSRPESQAQDPFPTSRNVQPPRSPTSTKLLDSLGAHQSPPRTSQHWNSQTQPFRSAVPESVPETYATERPASASHLATLGAIWQAVAEHDVPSSDAWCTVSRDIADSKMRDCSQTHAGTQYVPLNSTDSSERPYTALSRTSVSSALDLPPLQRPRILEHDNMSSAKSQMPLNENGCSSRCPVSAVPAATGTQVSYDSRHNEADHRFDIAPGGTQAVIANPATSTQRSMPTVQLPPVVNSLNNHARSTRVPRQDSSLDAPHEVLSPPAASKVVSRSVDPALPGPRARQKLDDDSLSRVYDGVRSFSYNDEAEVLDQYARQSPEDRQAALDQFMVENLENPTFATLCEDVEGCWRRIALGL